jgi:hypothetical protein
MAARPLPRFSVSDEGLVCLASRTILVGTWSNNCCLGPSSLQIAALALVAKGFPIPRRSETDTGGLPRLGRTKWGHGFAGRVAGGSLRRNVWHIGTATYYPASPPATGQGLASREECAVVTMEAQLDSLCGAFFCPFCFFFGRLQAVEQEQKTSPCHRSCCRRLCTGPDNYGASFTRP